MDKLWKPVDNLWISCGDLWKSCGDRNGEKRISLKNLAIEIKIILDEIRGYEYNRDDVLF